MEGTLDVIDESVSSGANDAIRGYRMSVEATPKSPKVSREFGARAEGAWIPVTRVVWRHWVQMSSNKRILWYFS